MKVYHPNFFDAFGTPGKIERKLYVDSRKILYMQPAESVVKLPPISESIISKPNVYQIKTPPKEDLINVIFVISIIALLTALLYIIYENWKERKDLELRLAECQLAKKLVY